MKILITGITGFSGYHLYNKLCVGNNEIWGIYKGMSNKHFKNAHMVECDIADYDSICEVIEDIKPDCIYHLAAFVYVGRTDVDIEKMFQTNVTGTVNLLKVVQDVTPLARILITGSAEEYGMVEQDKMPIKECCGLKPRNLYGLSKKFQEEAGMYYHRLYDLDIVFTRTFHYYGPYQPLNFVFADFASQIIDIENSGRDYIDVGNLEAERDFTDIRDVVEAYRLIVEKGHKGEVYNVCSNSLISIDEILRKYLRHAKKEIRINIDKNKLRPLDVPRFIGDNHKLKSIGWETKFKMDETIEEILDCWRKDKLSVNS